MYVNLTRILGQHPGWGRAGLGVIFFREHFELLEAKLHIFEV